MSPVKAALWCIVMAPLWATCAAPEADRTEAAVAQIARVDGDAASTPVLIEEVEPERRVTITGSGDILVHLKVAESARHHVDEGAYDWVFDGLARALPRGDVAFANLETPLAVDVVPVRSGTPPILGAPPEVAGALARAGIDVLSLANNHSFDQESLGLARTLSAVRDAGLAAVGAGADLDDAHAPIVIERDGVRIAFVGVTEYVNQCAGGRPAVAEVADVDQEAEVEASLAYARGIADVVVVGVHWSYDFQREPSQRQERLARRLVALGADILFGTGPHVLQRVDRLSSPRGDALVAYSLGNLISNQGMRYRPGREPPTSHFPMLDPASRDNVLLRVAVRIGDGARVVIERAEAVPLWTENNFWARELEETERMDIRLVALADTPPEVGVERRAAIRNALGPVVELASR